MTQVREARCVLRAEFQGRTEVRRGPVKILQVRIEMPAEQVMRQVMLWIGGDRFRHLLPEEQMLSGAVVGNAQGLLD